MDELSGFTHTMSDKLFSRFSQFIHTELGIKMPEAKKTMLQARLQKRLRKLGIKSFDAYYDYVFSSRGMKEELHLLIDVVTTNKTEFFREPRHFDYLCQKVLPEVIHTNKAGPAKKTMLWSAGCSSGEEVYTLAMVLNSFSVTRPGFDFCILGTDICTESLEEGAAGIYTHERIEPVPVQMRKKYLLKSRDRTKNLVRIIPELRAKVIFRRLNFMSHQFSMKESMDIVFFRNVLIYFDRPTQEKVLNNICRHLKPNGYLFTGHSETLNGLDIPLTPVVSTVYRKM
ncbi:protein-glutamate O-methyltransferase [Desulfobacterales bacterium HSG16]|nr:protein-glutamate O-methyltransferase [Desulfobacterales bacterium HSG16]